ncbi:DNA repair endonuclease xp-f / mei-9 / rad1, putative [Entamoeba dispar SAW760]|uniref:DNA repair endonuclease xp-f / mei-9 / rad1, putative n=1 Tax=Entamoeba dispar (strain ATCC PRA-260 / SAW760) TaxID=370354 RepID=B0EL04_ENTDS|nr:DNA repair endonuclease xp-f / mei-9 / rad1, putative [Entamoeba dispar SAW760]EDR24766.1 DNA repair endonuclease xp-f / mei-9 / rad1, putative [Entamoeba dispar SAW760]|eukprot:EDR24766.1 DNA repair endonuclease xp-f / mei-9 / rad1, putative [Entamoeba dispar SAW760]
MEQFVDKVALQVISCKSFTILSHGYLLPEISLSAVHKDMKMYLSHNKSVPAIFLINAPPHIFHHFKLYSEGLTFDSSTIKEIKKRKSEQTLYNFIRSIDYSGVDSSSISQSGVSELNQASVVSSIEDIYIPLLSIDYKLSVEKRKELYKNGGIFFITTRILISDLISNEFNWNNCIFYIFDIEDIQKRFNISFVGQVFLTLTKNKGLLRCLTQKTHQLVVVPKIYERIKEIFRIDKVFFFSYTFPELIKIRSEFKFFNVIQLKLQMADSMKIIEQGIFESMKYIAIEIRHRLNIQSNVLPDSMLLFGEFEKRISNYNKGINYDSDIESMCVDIKTLRHLMFSLYILNPVLFFIQLETMKLLVWGEDSLFWLGKKTMELVTETTKARLWNKDKFLIEKQPKHIEMMNIIKHENEKGNDVVIVVRNQQTKQELIHSWNVDDGTLLDIYQQWFDKKNELEKHIKEIHLKYRTDANSKIKKWKFVQSEGINLNQKIEGENGEVIDIDDKDDIKPEDEIIFGYNNVMYEMSQKFYLTQQMIIEETQQKLSQMKKKNEPFNCREYKGRINKIITQNEMNNELFWDKPKAIILYNCSLWVTRVLETYVHSRDEEIKLYLLFYEKSYEMIKYQQTILREKNAFEHLVKTEMKSKELNINQKEIEVIPIQDRVKTIIVDIREFRCELPFHLFNQNFKLIPKQLEIGDYILSPNICIERKSAIDLAGSLKSRRINKQIQNMFRKYNTVVLLIECYSSEGFEQYDSSKTEQVLKPYTNIFTQLIIEFPQLKIVWSYSPQMTVHIFNDLKQNDSEPTEEDCKMIESDDDLTNWNALEVLKRMPGITTNQLFDIEHNPNLTFSKLIQMNEEQLKDIIKDDKNVKLFHHACNLQFK